MNHGQKKTTIKSFLKARTEIKIKPLAQEIRNAGIKLDWKFVPWILDTLNEGYPVHWCKNTRNINAQKEIDAVFEFMIQRYDFKGFQLENNKSNMSYTGTFFGAKFVNHTYEPTEEGVKELLQTFPHKYKIGDDLPEGIIQDIAYSSEWGATIKIYKVGNSWMWELKDGSLGIPEIYEEDYN